MAKKRVHTKAPKYKSFHLHGHYQFQRVLMYVLLDLAVSSVVGLILQIQITQALASY